jgi:uncharacterized membrane protein
MDTLDGAQTEARIEFRVCDEALDILEVSTGAAH